MIFYGIADAHGIESFEPVKLSSETETFKMEGPKVSLMVLRAQANRHRHAVVYSANVSLKDSLEIYKMLDNGEFVEALLKLKECATDIKLAKMPGSEKSWNLIPNADLDPYS